MKQQMSEFRIELEPHEPSAELDVARYWYWLSGTILGEPEAACSLELAAAATEGLLRWEGTRRDSVLASKSIDALYTELYLGLIVDFDAGVELGKYWRRYARFQALPTGTSSFDGWSAFLVESDELARFIWRSPGRTASVCEAHLPLGAFEVALRAFQRALDDRLRGRCSVAPASGMRVNGRARGTG